MSNLEKINVLNYLKDVIENIAAPSNEEQEKIMLTLDEIIDNLSSPIQSIEDYIEVEELDNEYFEEAA